jgi:hypothetical protein
MKLATIVFVVSQFVVASVFALSWLAEDGWVIDWPPLREHSWRMLICAQAMAFAAGVWEGVAGPGGRARVFACAAGPVALVVWFMLQSLYWSWPGVSQIVVLPPAIIGTSILFAPSWAAVAVGDFAWQRSVQRHLR